MLGPEQRDTAADLLENLRRRPTSPEDSRIKFPGPAALDRPHGRPRHVVHDVGQHVRLVRHRSEPGQGVGHGRVDPKRPECGPFSGGSFLRGDVCDRSVDDHDAADFLGVLRRSHDRCPAAHAVSDDDRRTGEAGVRRHADDLSGPAGEVVLITAPAVAMAGHVDGDDPVLAVDQRCDVVPPARMAAPAVHENDSRAVALPPVPVADPASVDLGRVPLGPPLECGAEPSRSLDIHDLSAMSVLPFRICGAGRCRNPV